MRKGSLGSFKRDYRCPKMEEKIIKEWFRRSVKRGAHLMYGKKYKDNTGARGVPKSAHNHALTSAISHMQLGIILNDHKYKLF